MGVCVYIQAEAKGMDGMEFTTHRLHVSFGTLVKHRQQTKHLPHPTAVR